MMIYPSLIIILTLSGLQSMKNGRQVDTIDFQSVVSIRYQSFHLCSGTIIDEYHILTVAHVVIPYPASSLLVVPGLSVVRWPYRTKLTVQNTYWHPHYRGLTEFSFGESVLYWENDIAILRLKEPVLLSFSIGVVSLGTTNIESYLCFGCTMISWNYPDESDLGLVVLMSDSVTLVENNKCAQWGINVLVNQQCFIDLLETAFISTEDLGSPIICGDSMVGLIVKEARQEDATSPAVFLSTIKYVQFISDVINEGETNAQPGEFPYLVSIWNDNTHVCGGVIVNAYQVVTAGHCLLHDNSIYSAEVFKIAVGNTTVTLFEQSIQWYLVSHLQVHPQYLPNYDVSSSSWQAEHDIGLITVSTPFSWSSTVQRLRFAALDDFSTNQWCQVLHWRRKRKAYRKEYRELTKTNAVIVGDEQLLLVHLGAFQIAAKEQYSSKSSHPTDIGNPIICGGHPLGIMVRMHRVNVESQNSQIKFLRIRPYASMGFFAVQ